MARIADLFPECCESPAGIRFDLFVDRVLNHPRHGYYSQDNFTFGKLGDFYTSPHVHFFFAEVLAEQFLQVWEALGCPETFSLLEMGPGDGALPFQILSSMERRFPAFYRTVEYLGLEASPRLCRRLRRKLSRFPSARILCESYKSARVEPFSGCVFSNEFLDALPFRRLRKEAGGWQEWFVRLLPQRVEGYWKPVQWPPEGTEEIPEGAILEWREAFDEFYRFASA
ncbi:MAG: SAM-dependent methyltransferase, partial [Acidobacteria bacterium]|nr:SAM-dependent methyltransferase [Acidobacteriota bacterium]